MAASSGIVIVLGAWVGSRLPERVTRLAGAAAFFVFAALLLIEGLRSSAGSAQ